MLSEIKYCLKETKVALLVEDEPINQIVSSKILEKIGFHVDVASNGIEALKIFECNNYDIIFMDLQMPFMDGYEATKNIRKNNKDIPIVALTASVLIEDMTEVQKNGLNDFLQKPINDTLLKKCISSFFDIYEYTPKEEKTQTSQTVIKSEKQLLREEVDELISNIENDDYIKSTKIEKIIKSSKSFVFDLDFVSDLKHALNSFNNNEALKFLRILKEHLA